MADIRTTQARVSYGVSEGANLSIALDAEKNAEVYGEKKSTFFPGEKAYLHITRTLSDAYTLHSSAGKIVSTNKNMPYDISEDFSFVFESSKTLSDLPAGSVSWKWFGKSGGGPVFDRRQISLHSSVVGILQCSYKTYRDQAYLLVLDRDINVEDAEEFPVLAVVKQNDSTASCTVQYGGDSLAPIPIDLHISDFCSDEDLSEVDVYMDGSFIGKSNTSGKIYLGLLVPGTVHTLKMTKTGYRDSDQDILHNDKFTVPTS